MLIISCPHCNQSIEVVEINCRIFRCGIMKSDFKQINPHLPKSECDRLFAEQLIYGCGKPFKLVKPTATSLQNLNRDKSLEPAVEPSAPLDPLIDKSLQLDQAWTVEICGYE